MLLKSWAMPAGQPPDRLELLGLEQLRLQRLAGRDVDDRGEHLRAVGGRDRREADLHGELGAVPAPPGQVEADAHRPGDGMGYEAVAMGDVAVGDALGKEQLDGLADELVAGIPERGLDLGVGVGDVGGRVHSHDRVGRRLEHGAETPRVIGRSGLASRFAPARLTSVSLLRGRHPAASASRIQPGLKGALAHPCAPRAVLPTDPPTDPP